mgnify:CR=1 FL=1
MAKSTVEVPAIPDSELTGVVKTRWYLQGMHQVYGLHTMFGDVEAAKSPCCDRPVFSCSWSTIDLRRQAIATASGHRDDWRCEGCGRKLKPLPLQFEITNRTDE